jgi:hypothetical protein
VKQAAAAATDGYDDPDEHIAQDDEGKPEPPPPPHDIPPIRLRARERARDDEECSKGVNRHAVNIADVTRLAPRRNPDFMVRHALIGGT